VGPETSAFNLSFQREQVLPAALTSRKSEAGHLKTRKYIKCDELGASSFDFNSRQPGRHWLHTLIVLQVLFIANVYLFFWVIKTKFSFECRHNLASHAAERQPAFNETNFSEKFPISAVQRSPLLEIF